MSLNAGMTKTWLAIAVAAAVFGGIAEAAGEETPPNAEEISGAGDENSNRTQFEEQADQDEPGDMLEEPGRRSLEMMNRQELLDAGFVFEDTVLQQNRAHATAFAMTAGAIVPGAGHRHLDDSRTALALVGVDLTAYALLVGGAILALRPTGQPVIDERRRDMWFLGLGLLGASWVVDVFGTAYRDDLGIPDSSHRYQGWGLGLRYEYWPVPDLSMRHVATTELVGRSRHFEVQGRTSQELGVGMSDYEVIGRWDPFIGSSEDTRVGFSLGTRYLQYRLDQPFRRADLRTKLHLSLNLGRLFAHLDQMTAGFSVGVGWRGYRFVDEQEEWSPLLYAGWRLPMRMSLALNLTEQLRLTAAFERGQGEWLQRSRSRIGVPIIELAYQSTDRLDLHFSSTFGHGIGLGIGLGAGLRVWFGE